MSWFIAMKRLWFVLLMLGFSRYAFAVTIAPVASPTNVSEPAIGGALETGESGVWIIVNTSPPERGTVTGSTWSHTVTGLQEGVNSIVVNAVDAEEITVASREVTVVLDTIAPDTTITARPADPSNARTGNFLFSSPEPDVTFYCSMDGAAYVPCNSPQDFDYSTATDSDHTFSVRAQDLALNSDQTPASYSWTIDTEAPGTPVVTGMTATNDSTPAWSWSSGGGGGNGTFRYRLDDSDLSSATESSATSFTPASALGEGSHTLYVQERDVAGNWSASGSFGTVVDLSAPSATVSGAPASFTAQTSASLTVGGAGVVAYKYQLDGAGYGAGETPVATGITLESLANGAHQVSVIGRDAAGNWQGEGAATTVTWTVDTAAPAVDAGADQTRNGSFTQSGTVTDATALSYQWSKQSGTGSVTFGSPSAPVTTVSADADGSYLIRLTATDAAGNSSYDEMTLVWDTTPPTVDATASFLDSIHVEVTFSETVTGAELAANYAADQGLGIVAATSAGGSSYRLTTTLQTVGTVYLVSAGSAIVDLAGNAVGNSGNTASFSRPAQSNHAPGVPVLNAPPNGTPNLNEVATLTPVLSVHAASDADGDPVTYRFEVSAASDFTTLTAAKNGVTASDGIASWTVDLPLADNSSYYWRVLANDGYVNSSYMPTGSFFVSSANLAPAGVALSSPGDGTEVTTLTPVLALSNGTDANRDTVSYQFAVASDSGFSDILSSSALLAQGGSGSTSWTVPAGTLSDNTLYFWRGRGVDQHGLAGEWVTASFFANTSNDAPSAPTLSAPPNGTFNQREVTSRTPLLVVANASDADRDTLSYRFEIDSSNSFNSAARQSSPPVPEGSGSTSWTPAALADNTVWYWRVKANDGASDGPWMESGSFFVNTANNPPTAPTVQNPADNSWVATTPNLSVNAATDLDHDPLSYEFAVHSDSSLSAESLVAGASGQGTGWKVEPPLADLRRYYWRVRAKDSHDSYSDWSTPLQFYVDGNEVNDLPAITITAPGGTEPSNGTSYTIRWSATDPDSDPALTLITLYYDTDGSGYDGTQIASGIRMSDPASYSWNTAPLPDGTYYIYARITDEASSASAVYAGPVVIDRTPPAQPVVSGVSPVNDSTPTWSWSSGGGGNGTYRYRLDNSDLSSATEGTATSFTPASALGEGSHTLYVQERDAAGNWSGSGSFATVVDLTAPSAALSGVPASFTAQTGASLTVSGAGVVAYKYKLDSAPYSAGEIPVSTRITLSSLADGAHQVSVIGRDAAGNWQSEGAAATISWTVDTAAPAVNAGADQTRNGSFTQSGTVADATALSYQWSKQSGPGTVSFGTASAPVTTISADTEGSYTLRLTATDAAGNSTYDEMTLVWDTTPPTVDATASFLDSTHVEVRFSETVTGAELAANYAADHGLGIVAATSAGGSSYRLTTTLQTVGTVYVVSAGSAIVDLAGNAVGNSGNTASFSRPAQSNHAPAVPVLNAPPNGTPNLNEVATLTPVLSVHAASDADGDPVTYRFEVSAASDFATLTAAKSGVTASDGIASWTVDLPLADNSTYYWRVLANDGYVNSSYMPTGSFFVSSANLAPAGVALSSPGDGTEVSTLTPVLALSNGTDANRDTVSYQFAVASDSGFSDILSSSALLTQGGSGSTSWTVPAGTLSDNTLYFWRGRGVDQHGLAGEWVTASFFANTSNDAPSAPTLSAPPNGTFNLREVTSRTPLLVVTNASDADRDTLSYRFEIDSSNSFNSGAKQSSPPVPEGSGSTSWTPAALADNTVWYWRVKANDGASDGPWMESGSFFVNTANNAPTAPTVQNPADNSWVATTPNLSVNAATDLDHDPLSYEFAVHSDSSLSAESLVAGASGQGTGWKVEPPLADLRRYYWRVRAKDSHDSYSDWSAPLQFYVDGNEVNDLPAITITAPGGTEPSNGTSYTIRWSASDPDSDPALTLIALYYDTDGSGYDGTQIAGGIRMSDPASYSWNTAPLPDGTYYIYARITDEATSTSASYAGPVVVDRTPPAQPVVSGVSPVNDSTPTWRWSSGGGGNGTYRYRLDNSDLSSATEGSATSFTPASPLGEGSHTLYVQERDAAGNWSGSGSFATVVDLTAPSATVSGAPASFTTQGGVSLTVGGAGVVAYKYKLDSAPYSAGEIPVSTVITREALANGAHQVSVIGRDAAGNWQSEGAATTVSWTVDTVPPAVNAGADQTRNGSFTQSGTVTDATALSYQWSKQAGPGTVSFGTASAPVTTISASSEGSYTLRLTATDVAGNSSYDEMTLVWDTTSPAVNAGVDRIRNSSFTQSGTVTDATALSYQWSKQSGPGTVSFGTASAPVTTMSASSEGSYTLRLTATDAAGNSAYDDMTLVWDTTIPTVSAGADQIRNGSFTQSATVTDATSLSYQWSKQSGPGTVTFGSPSAPVTTVSADADGSYLIRLTATDAAGNSTYDEMTLVWDTTPPTVDATASFLDSTHVEVRFSETVTGAELAANYAADHGLGIVAATSAGGSSYRLTTTLQTVGTVYVVSAGSAIVDLAGNAVPGTGKTASFFRPAQSNHAPGVPVLNAPPNGTPNLNEVATLTPVLSVHAASDTDGDPVTYRFEVSATSDFATLKTAKNGVTASDGIASWTVDLPLADNSSYYWRVLANDGYVNSSYMPTGSFFVSSANLAPAGVALSSPGDGTEVSTLTPVLALSNATDANRDTVSYQFAVASDSGFSDILSSSALLPQGGSGSTSWTVPAGTLSDNTLYFWRGRGVDQHGLAGEWVTASFFANTSNDAPSAPTLSAPPNGTFNLREVTSRTPLLVVANASDADRDTLSYRFEIDSSNSFNSAAKQSSPPVPEGSGSTSWTPAALADNTLWYWRVKANDGASDGPWMESGSFFVNTANNPPTAPTVQNPADNSWVATTPNLSVNAATDLDHDPLSYEFAVYSDSSLSAESLVAGASGQGTGWKVEPPLADLRRYYWRVRAKDSHDSYSDWSAPLQFYVDGNEVNDLPAITITAPGGTEPSNGTSYTIRWSASDPDSDPALTLITLYYDTDGSGYDGTQIAGGIRMSDPASYSWNTAPLPDGTYYIYARITDEATSTSAVYAGPVVVDRTPPAQPVVSGVSPVNDSTPTWSWSSGGGGNGTFRYRLDNSDLSSATESTATSFTPASPLGEASHTLYVQERDAAGNWSGSGSFATLVDLTAPSATLSGAPASFTAQTGASLTVSGVGVLAYKYRVDAAPYSAGEIPVATRITLNSLANGAHQVSVIGRDAAGNWQSEGSATTVSWTVDNAAPAVNAGADQTRNGSFTQSGTVTDATALSYQWSKQTGPGTVTFGSPGAPVTTISASAEGSYILRLTATDAAGNSSYDEMVLVWDSISPTVNAGADRVKNGSFTQSGTVSDATAVSYQWSKQLGPGTVSFGSPGAPVTTISASSEGSYTLRLTATDAAGNSAYDEMTLVWDSTSPAVNAGVDRIRNSSFTQSATVTDVTALSYQWSKQSGPGNVAFGSPGAPITTMSADLDGSYTLRLTATDAAGNSSYDEMTLVWDSISPTVSAGADQTRNGSFTQSGTVTDATALIYHWSKQSGPGTVSFGSPGAPVTTLNADTDGRYLIRLTVTDAAGNSSYDEMTLVWDSTRPTVNAGADQTRNGNFTQSGTVTDATALSYQWSKQSGPGSVAFGSPSSPVTTISAGSEGSYILRLTATDAAGNSSYDEMTLVWDTSTPAVSAGADQIRNGSFTQSGTVTDATALSYQWSKQSGPGTVTFGSPSAPVTTVSADADGSYLIRLTATDAAGNSTYDEMTLVWDTTPPTVDATASFLDSTHVEVRFSETVTGADLAANYAADHGLGIVAATSAGGSSYRLTTTLQTVGTVYVVSAGSGIVDLAGNAVPGTGKTASFFRPAQSNHAPAVPVLNAPPNGTPNQNEVATLTPVLSVHAASDADGDPVTYRFELSATSDFATLKTAKNGVTASDGIASWTVDTPLADNSSYYWRVLANDGYVNSSYMPTGSFFVSSANLAPAGVALSSPGDGTEVSTLTPVLALSNATDANRDTVSYQFAVASDSGFSDILSSSALLAQGGSGSTSWTVPAGTLSDNTLYFWRGRAVDQHGLAGGWVTASFFANTSNDAPSAPTLSAPPNGTFNLREVTSRTPLLVVANASDADRDTLSYRFEIDSSNSFNSAAKQSSPPVPEGSGSTSWTPAALADNTVWYWRVKANDGASDGPWMESGSFFVNTANNAPTAPTVQNPADNSWVATTPNLSVNAATDLDHDPLSYEFAVYSDSSLSAESLVAGASGQGTGWKVEPPLADLRRYYWRVRAKDSHDSYSDWSAPLQFYVDGNEVNDLPAITITAPGGTEPSNGTSYTIRWSASDPDSDPALTLITLYYDTDGGGYDGTQIASGIRMSDPASYSWNTAPLPDGTYYIYARITDEATSRLAAYAGPVVVDRTPPAQPVVSGVSPVNDSTPTWSWSSGGGGNGTFRYRLDNSDLSSATESTATSFTPASPLGEASHTLYVQERDAAGNWSGSGSFAALVDLTAPSAALSGAPPSFTAQTGASLTVSGVGVLAYKYRVDSAPYSAGEIPVTTRITLSSLANGAHQVSVLGRDAAGNWQSEGSATTVSWTVDNAAPAVNAGADQTRNGSFTQSGTVTDATALSYQWSKQSGPGTVSFGTASAPVTTISADAEGSYTLRLTATDAAGNSSYDEMVLVWDSISPAVNAGTDQIRNGSFTQSATASDATALSYQWSKQSGPGTVSFGTASAPVTTISASSEGRYTLRLTVTDAAGNSSYDEMILMWDTSLPVVNAGADQTRKGSFTQNGTATDVTALSCQWSKQSGPGTVSFGSPGAPLTTMAASAEGSYILRLTATDAAGNSSYDEMTLVWDTSTPVVSAGADQIRNGSFTQSGTATDATALSYQWSKQSGPGIVSFGSPGAPVSTIFVSAEGSYTLRLTATDAAGNSSYDEMTLVWDTTPPTVGATASFLDSTHVEVSFSETVTGAELAASYAADRGLGIVSATKAGGSSYRLSTTLQTVGTVYVISAGSGIVDLAGNAMGNSGNTASFSRPAQSNHAPGTPVLNAPPNGTPNLNEITTRTPLLSVQASGDTDGDPVTYRFEVSAASDFATLTAARSGLTASDGIASWTVDTPLADNSSYYWRALANDGYVNSSFTPTGSFFVSSANLAPAGVTLSSPGDGTEVTTLTPVLALSNGTDANRDTVRYQFALASDSGFSDILSSSALLAQESDGSTSWTVPAGILSDNTLYFWRGRGVDQHGLAGEWVIASFFANTSNEAPSAPTLSAPPNGTFNQREVTSRTPLLVVANASDPDRDTLSYRFEIDSSNSFNSAARQSSPPVPEGSGSTSWTPAALADNTVWYWRVKANDGASDGPWMESGSFFVNTANNAPTAPSVQNPADNSRVPSTAPNLSVNAATDPDHDPLSYEFAVFSDSSLNPSSQVAGATDQGTGWKVDPPLQNLTTYYWTVRARDSHNYYSSWMPARTFLVDDDGTNDPPAITIARPAAGEPPITGSSNASYQIRWNSSDPDSDPAITLYYDTDGSGYDGSQIATGIRMSDPASYSWDTAPLPDGTYYIYARISDELSSVLSPYAGPVVIDRTPPSPPVLSGASPSKSATPTWSWHSGGGGDGTFRYRLDNGDLGSGATETSAMGFTPLSALSEGSHTLYLQERDAAGNWSGSASRTIVTDTVLPRVTGAASSSAAGSYRAGSVINVTLGFSEPVSSSGLVLVLSSGGSLNTGPLANVTSYSASYTVAAGEGTSLLNLTEIGGIVTDAAGNAISNPGLASAGNIGDSRTIVVDTTAPVVSAGADRIRNSFFTQSASASDQYPMSYSWSKKSGPGEIVFGTPGALSTAVSASKDGEYLLRFTATDQAGNAASSEMTLVWDTAPPKVASATSSTASGFFRAGSAVNVTVNFSEPVSSSGLTIALDSGASIGTGPLASVASFSGTYSVAQGENSAALKVTGLSGSIADAAGNSSNAPAIPAGENISDSKSLVIDTVSPETTLLSTPAHPTNSRQGSFSFSSAESSALFECSMDAGDFAACNSPYHFDFGTLPDGSHSFQVRGKDPAGNIDPSPARWNWTINTVAPSAVILGAPTGLVNSRSLAVTVAGAGVVAYRYKLDQNAYSPESPVAQQIELASLAEGSHTLSVIGKDSAGNWQAPEQAASATWSVDLTLPAFQEVSTLPDGSYTNRNELNIAGVVRDDRGLVQLGVEVATAASVYSDSIAVNEEGGFSYLLKEKLAAGENLVRLVARDAAGNQSLDQRRIHYDPNAPQLVISAPADNSTTSRPYLDVTGTVDKNVQSVEVKVLDCQQVPVLLSSRTASVSGASFLASPDLAPGCNTILVMVTDLAGNHSSDKRTVTFDDQKPTLAVTEPSADLRTQASVMRVRGTVEDLLSEVSVTVTSGSETFTPAVVDGAFSQPITFTENRVYHITVKATDQGGNETVVQRNVIYAKPAKGDINNDGRVDIVDAHIALRISVGLLPQTDSDLIHGDVAPLVNGVPSSDGVIDVGDVVTILRAVVGLIGL